MRLGYFLHTTASLLAISLGSAALAQAPAPATTAATAEEPTDIVVTGIRQSLQSTRDLKRNAVQVIDSVVAEDIGKLPDIAVSDTAARIPGVQVIRQGGEASRVLVRGLPDFTTTYNGREIFTAETRVVALQDFPSSNIAALEVYKTSTANLVEPGLAGLVNVRSRRPFDFTRGEISASVWGLYTKQGDKVTPNFNVLLTDRWQTGIGDIGILLNASVTEMKYLDSQPETTDFIADPNVNGQTLRFPDIFRLRYGSGDRIRPSGNAAIQWRPSPGLEFYVEALYQGYREKVDDRLLEIPVYGGTLSNIVTRNGSNLLRSATVTNPGGALFAFQGGTYRRTDTYQFAGGGKYETGPFKLTFDVARTDTTFQGQTESVDRFAFGNRTVAFNLDNARTVITGINLFDPATYVFRGLYEENQRAVGKDWQARTDATYKVSDTGLLRSLEAGVRYVDRNALRNFANRYGEFVANRPAGTAIPLTFAPTPAGFSGADIPGGTSTFLSPTYDSIRANIVALRQFVITNKPDGGFGGPFTTTAITPAPVFTATEQSIAGYLQANLAIGDAIDGLVGIRGVRVKTRVVGAVPTNVPSLANGSETTDWLPNASVRWHILPTLQLRLSFAQTRTRPNFGDLAPGSLGSPQTDAQTGATFRAGNFGNPNLRPFTSNNYDASLEWYFTRTGFVSAAVFRRDLNGFIQNREFRFTDPALGAVRITTPLNTGRGRIDGIEVQGQTFFDFLPAPFDGLGIQANYTLMDAKTDFFDTGVAVRDRILGVSRWSYLLTGLYEKGPVSARLSYFKRSSSDDSRQYRSDDFYKQYDNYPGRLDASVNLNFHPRATLFADWTNILARPFTRYLSSARNGAPRAEFVNLYRYEETTFSVGLRFRIGGGK